VNANLLHGYGFREVHVVRRFEDDFNSETPGQPANQEIVCSGSPGSAERATGLGQTGGERTGITPQSETQV
jgi:hypothetical protein